MKRKRCLEKVKKKNRNGEKLGACKRKKKENGGEKGKKKALVEEEGSFGKKKAH